jgi:hypothetical protein
MSGTSDVDKVSADTEARDPAKIQDFKIFVVWE